MAERGHNGHKWRMIWRAVIFGPDFLVCGICYQPIDRRIRGRVPQAPSVDMIVPFDKGGDPHDMGNLRPSHYGCNSRRGAGRPTRRQWIADDTP